MKLQYASFWESDTKCAILTAANFNNAWEQHLLKQGRGADMKGSVSLLHKSKPHLIHVWSALRCALTMDSSPTENMVKAFWEGAAPSLRKLLSVWVTGPMGDHETRSELMQTQQGLAREALMYIRQIRPAWPDLGESDFQRLTAYVVSGSDLYSAWLNRKELQPLETPAKQPQPHLTLAIAYSTDTVESTYTKNSVKSKSSADQPAAAAQRRSKSATGNDRSTIASKPGHDDLANAPGLDDLANAAARAQAAESQADSAAQAETESEPESHQSAGLGRMDSSPSGFFASPVYEGSLDHAEAPCASDHCDGLEGASPDCDGLGAELLLEVPTAPNASLGIQQGQNDIMTAHVKASAEHDLSGNQNVIMAELPNASAENDLSVGEGQNDIMAAHEGQQTAQCVEAAINQEGKVEKGKRKRTEKEKKGKVEKGKRKRTAEGGSVAQGAERRRRRASGVAPEAESTPAASAAAKPFNSAPSPSPPHHDSVSNAAHSKALDCRETDVFAESGYCSLNIEFSFDVKQQLNALMRNIPTTRARRVEYHTSHVGYQLTNKLIDSLLPQSVWRSALVPATVVNIVDLYLCGQCKLFAFELHVSPAGTPEQLDHSDINIAEARRLGISPDDISRLAVICIISIDGPVTTLVYPNTRATIETEDQLAGMKCVRATEHDNFALLDASLVHKGSANASDKDILRFIITFVKASASEKQIKLLKKCLNVKTPLDISVEQFLDVSKITTKNNMWGNKTNKICNSLPQVEIPARQCVVGSRVQGLFSDEIWYPGMIASINRAIVCVTFDDGDEGQYNLRSPQFQTELRHDPRVEEENIWMWNIIHSKLCAISECWNLDWELDGMTLRVLGARNPFDQKQLSGLASRIRERKGAVSWEILQAFVAKLVRSIMLSTVESNSKPSKANENASKAARVNQHIVFFKEALENERSDLRILMLVTCVKVDGTYSGSLQVALREANRLRGVPEILPGESCDMGAESLRDESARLERNESRDELSQLVHGADGDDLRSGECDLSLYDELQMQRIDDRVSYTDALWDPEPYATVTGKIGTVEGETFFVHPVLGNGDCFYLALAITIYKAWGTLGIDVLARLFPTILADRLSKIIDIGRDYASGNGSDAHNFRRLLSDHISTSGSETERAALERALAVRGGRTDQMNSGPAASPLCAYYASFVGIGHEPADEGVFEILMNFLPILRLHVFVTNGQTLKPCLYYHTASMNAFPQYAGPQLSIALHLRNAAVEMSQACSSSASNHYEAVTGINWSPCITAWVSSLPVEVSGRFDCDKAARGVSRKRMRSDATQSTLDQFGFAPPAGSIECSKCGGPGDYECTKNSGETRCKTCYCHKCMGHTTRKGCPPEFACEYHREIQRLGVVLRFQNSMCWECPERATEFCNICGKGLCQMHAQTTPFAPDIFVKEKVECRACMGTEAFATHRASAADKLLADIVGRIDRPRVDSTMVESGVRSKLSQLGKVQWAALVDEFSVFIYQLLVGGLCNLAEEYIKVLILINLKMFKLKLFMGLLPLHFCYMLSRDRAGGMANEQMLANVLVAFGSHILQNEVTRRRSSRIGTGDIGALDANRGRDGCKIRVGFFAWDLMKTSPTLDLLYGSLMGMDRDKFDVYLITFSKLPTKPGRQFGKRPAPEHDTSNQQAINLVQRFRGSIIYLYEKSSDADNLDQLMKPRLHVLYHVNGYQHGHIWRLLLMARVASVYIEYLASPFFLLSPLPDFTISSPGLPSKIQDDSASRERKILFPWMYGTESFFLEDILNFTPSSPDLTPSLIYLAGLGRWNDSSVICMAMEIIHGCGGDLPLKVQSNTDSMYSHLKQTASKYCLEKGWADYSHNIVTFPHWRKKANLIRYGENNPRHVVLAAGSVQPHTGTVDADLMGFPSLSLEGEDWPGRVAHVNNIQLGLGSLLNATSREDLVKKACRLFKDPELLDRVVAHMKLYRGLRRGPYRDCSIFLQAAAVQALEQVIAADRDRSKLIDIDLTSNPALGWEPIPEFEIGSTRIAYLGLNTGLRVSAMMDKMASIGRYRWDRFGHDVVALLTNMEDLAGLEFVDLAGWGGSRFALLARVKPPDTEKKRLEIGWFHGQEAIVKLLHPSEEGELPSIRSLCNDPNLREGKLLLVAQRPLARAGRMRSCLPKLIPVLPGNASAGFVKCGSSFEIVTFLICEAVGKSWYHSNRRSEIASTWCETGVMDETLRSFTRSLLHSGSYVHNHLGIALMDCSVANICETSQRIPWLRHEDIQTQMPSPSGFVFCDLGAGYDIGTVGQRTDGDVRRGNENRDRVLSRMATHGAAAKRQSRPCPRVPRPDSTGMVILSNPHIHSIFQHRKGTGFGLGRLSVGTPDNRCELLADKWKKAEKGTMLSGNDCIQVDSGSFGNIIFAQVCPRMKPMTEAAYNKIKKEAVKSPQAMQQALERFVKKGVTIKQQETVRSFANLLYWMLRADIKKRIDIMAALCHPFTSLRILSTEEYVATMGTGYHFPVGCGPQGSPWENVTFPAWDVRNVVGKGLGCFAHALISHDSKKPVALYCGLHFEDIRGDAAHEWPPGRCNVSIGIGAGTNMAIGELPIAVLRERRSPGALFNAADSDSPANLSLRRFEYWADPKGLVYIPLYTLRDIPAGEEGLWSYPHVNGAAGALYSFNDSRFMVQESDKDSEFGAN